MDKNKWMRDEIVSWRNRGIIDDVTADKLSALYPLRMMKSIGLYVMGAIGALLISLGVLALIAANWGNCGLIARTLFAVLPTVCIGILATWQYWRGVTSRLFWEPTGVLWCAAVVGGIALIAQTYNLGGFMDDFILGVLVLTMPVVFISRSFLASTIWMAMPTVWMCVACDNKCPANEVLAGVVILCLISVVMMMRVSFDSCPAPCKWLAGFVFSISMSVCLIGIWIVYFKLAYNGHKMNNLVSGVYLFSAASILWLVGRILKWRTFKFLGAYLTICYAMTLSIIPEASLQLCNIGEWNLQSLAWTAFAGMVVLAIVARCCKVPAVDIFVIVSLACLSVIMVVTAIIHRPLLQIMGFLFLPLTLLVSTVSLVNGVRTMRISVVNISFLMIAGLIIIKFLSSSWSFTLKGIAMISAGCLVLALNIIMFKLRKNATMAKKEVAQ